MGRNFNARFKTLSEACALPGARMSATEPNHELAFILPAEGMRALCTPSSKQKQRLEEHVRVCAQGKRCWIVQAVTEEDCQMAHVSIHMHTWLPD